MSATAKWAQELLHFLLHRNGVAGPQKLLLLALLAEFVEACSRFIRMQEAGKSGHFHIARLASQLRDLEAQLSDLFDVRSETGEVRLPRALNRKYTYGYVNVVRESLRLETSSVLIAAGKVAWYNDGGEESLKTWALQELGSILNIKRVLLATFRSEIDHGVLECGLLCGRLHFSGGRLTAQRLSD